MALVMGIVAALGVPLYAARHRILARYSRHLAPSAPRGE
jgi:hypothetical protein